MNPLDSVLNGWRKAFDAACAQVELHRVLGFPATVLPTHDALRRATLAALGARVPLEMRVAPHVESLRAKGVLAPDASPGGLNAGVLVAIDLVLPYLHSVLGLVDGLATRAEAASEGASGIRAPRVRVPESISAALGQTVRVEIQCEDTERLIILAPALGMTRALLRPPKQLYLTASLFPGDLIVYAENNLGWIKVVRAMKTAAFLRVVPSARPFSRTAAARVPRRAERTSDVDFQPELEVQA